ncbi:DNA-binding protein [Mesorhizobium newzealandense]|uniref:DNA-binding protein n=1 Tax=Mesorhizobium newzealandense TaxID=1300302 RepID=A0ABW4UM00_9HYPH
MQPDAYRDRREAAAYLTAKGLRTSWRTLQKLACIGGGPQYRIYGRLAVYTDQDLDIYADGKLSAPRFSTSEAA